MNEEDGIGIVLLLDGSELVVVSAEEGLLPVELVSRSLRKGGRGMWTVSGTELEHGEWAWEFYLIEVCAGIRGYAFESLHILNEELTGSIDLCQVGTILPARADSGVDRALSPSRVKTRGLGVHTGDLSASDETVKGRKFSGFKCAVHGIVGKNGTD